MLNHHKIIDVLGQSGNTMVGFDRYQVIKGIEKNHVIIFTVQIIMTQLKGSDIFFFFL